MAGGEGRVFSGVRQRRPSALRPSKDASALAFLALVWGFLDSPSTVDPPSWPPLPHLGTPPGETTWSGQQAGAPALGLGSNRTRGVPVGSRAVRGPVDEAPQGADGVGAD